MVQNPPVRSAESTLVRVMIRAPRASASRAFSTTRRESSTQQSEYSNAFSNRGSSAAPSGVPVEA
jgi:hypothetical protein